MVLNKYHIIDSGKNGYTGMTRQGIATNNTLVIRHSAGFFSCCSIGLQDIMIYFNENKCMPDVVDRHAQYSWYKEDPNQSLIGHFFAETEEAIPYEVRTEMTYATEEPQYTDYSYINFEGVKPFLDKFFRPSQYILDKVAHLEEKYAIDYENTIGVLFRGNDKVKEAQIADYSEFISKAEEMDNSLFKQKGVHSKKFIIAPDETEFLNEFKSHHPLTLCMDETSHMPKDANTCIPLTLPLNDRAEQACNFFATLLIISKCKNVITHSGNISFWMALYRGTVKGVYQYLNGNWINH